MKLSELVTLYQAFVTRDAVKHGRSTSTKWAKRAATNNLLAVEVRGEGLADREPTASATPSAATPQLNLLAGDLPGDGGEPVRRLADVEIDQLTRLDLRDYLDFLLEKRHEKGPHKGKPWTMAHINGCRAMILGMMEWAEDEGHVAEGRHHELSRCKPLKTGKTIARKSTKMTAAEKDVVGELIKWCRKSADAMPTSTPYKRDLQRRRRLLAVAVELLWELGCRPQEIVLLKPSEIHEDPKGGGWLYLPGEWKTEHTDGAARIMVVNRRAKELIDEAIILRRTDGNQMLLTIADDFDPEARLFTWTADHPYHASNAFYNAVKRNLKRAGLPRMTNLQIRHAFGTRCAAVNPEGTRVQMGHTTLNTTMKYIDNNGPAVRALFEALEHDPRNGPRPTPPSRPNGTDAGDQTPFQLRLVGG